VDCLVHFGAGALRVTAEMSVCGVERSGELHRVTLGLCQEQAALDGGQRGGCQLVGVGGSVGVDINCAVIGFVDKAPTANLAEPVANSQFPPR
jgi:hypothetical protein